MKRFTILLSLLMLVLVACSSNVADITILHWNDFHAHNISWVPTNYNPEGHMVGGYAVLDAYLDSLEKVYPGALKVNAGDDFQGSPISSMTKGYSQIEILNKVKPDFFTLGNHEFDYGWKNLDSLRRNEAKFMMYSANLLDSESGETVTPEFRIFKRDGYTFALIGITTPYLDELTIPKNLEGLKLADPAETVKNVMKKLESRNIDLFIVVSHMGIGLDKKLAREVPEIDLIVGGHSHTYLREAVNENGVWIVQANAHGRYIGVTSFHVEKGEITELEMDYVETVTNKIRPSKDIAEIVMRQEAALVEVMDEIIGQLETPWTRRGLETNLGNWIADAFRHKTRVDVAMMNNGGIRKDLAAGDIKVRDIWEISPFGNTLVTFEWTGKELWDAMDKMTKSGRSMQVSGIQMTFKKDKGLISAKVAGKNIDPDRVYTICMNNYSASQGEKYFGTKIDDVLETGLIDRDVLLEEVRRNPNINSKVEGRLIIQ
ncbi:MAG: bifunctional UDP-sugar hydrolase/5'-nucleotidase [Candidatus Neomarinimicrobiota bacterium]